MVIGNGLIATAFKDFGGNDDYLFFCSGVSNSRCTDAKEFEREKNLLTASILQNKNKKFIYFSTCSILDPSMVDSLYVIHKLEMEAIIMAQCPDFYIFRLSNIVGKTKNRITVLNFLYDAIFFQKPFELWSKSTRNILDISDAVIIVEYIMTTGLYNNEITNIANPQSYYVKEIVMEIENYLGVHGLYSEITKGIDYEIPTNKIKTILTTLKLEFPSHYLENILLKYYPNDVQAS